MSKKKVVIKKKPCKCKDKKKYYYYKGVAFLAIQSGSEDQPTKKMERFISEFSIQMHQMRYRPSVVGQFGKPPGGGCVPGQPGCP